MHLWPSTKLRDSFKIAYLKKLEWNLNRMKSDKESPSSRQKLLDDGQQAVDVPKTPSSKTAVVLWREVLMIVSCCFCCYCCGACVDE